MNKEKQKDFARRVSQANKTQLVAVTFDIIVEYMDEACKKLEVGDIAEYRTELKSALDYTYPIAMELLRLYEYVQRVLVASDVSGTDKGLASARDVMAKLGASFTEISAQDESGAVMENTQQIVAGLTYGKGTLNEADMSAGSNRGFLA